MLGRLSKWMGIIYNSFFLQWVSNKMSSRQQSVAERGQRRNVTWKGRRSWRGGFRATCQRESTLMENQEKWFLKKNQHCSQVVRKKNNKPEKRKSALSYDQRWFRRVSWACRPRTATCWCTCGNGRCLSTCSRTPCAARILTPPTPPAFYFGDGEKGGVEKKGKQHSTRKSDERGGAIHHGARNRFQRFVFPRDGVR